ncbi:MAG: PilZ domain-containing protein [Acidobacteria bacterium]|nr:PilZ domain-containing protein [Acidobacteriota bacterium]
MCAVRVGDWSGPEQRKARRVALGASIECRDGFDVYQGKAENISVTGLLIRSEKQSSEDKVLAVSFFLPGHATRIQAEARVAHIVPGVFMGLEFSTVSELTQSAIEQYVNSVPTSELKP